MMKNAGVFFSLSLLFLFVVCCFMLLNIQIEDYTMLQRRTSHDFETYTPVSYVTNKIHSYDAEDVFLGQIERGERSLSLKTLCRITSFTGTSTDYILFGNSSNNTLMNKINKILLKSSDLMLEYAYKILIASYSFFKKNEIDK